MKLSVLDHTPIKEGESSQAAFRRTIALAGKAEEWGYHRFWLSEHHFSSESIGTAPEIVIAHLLAKTKHIRLGSGGVMLQHYSPYKVAEQFHVLDALGPGRVDLGIGRAPGGLPLSTLALQAQQDGTSASLNEKLQILHYFLQDNLPEQHPLYGLRALPAPSAPIPVFTLGTSQSSAELAARSGTAYVFAQFINSDEEELSRALESYRKEFDSGAGQRSPYVIAAVSVVVADTDEEAQMLVSVDKNYRVTLEDGKKINVGHLDKAKQFIRESGQLGTIEVSEKKVFAGKPEKVRDELYAFQEETGIDELMIVTKMKDQNKRMRSFQLLAEATLANV